MILDKIIFFSLIHKNILQCEHFECGQVSTPFELHTSHLALSFTNVSQ